MDGKLSVPVEGGKVSVSICQLKVKAARKYSVIIARIPLSPNTVTTFGWAFCIIGVYFVYKGLLSIAAIFIFLMFLCDILDGAIARVRQKATLVGTFYDWFTDKCVEAMVLFSLRFVDSSGLPEFASVLSLVLGGVGAKADKYQVNHNIGAWSKIARAPVLILLLITGYVYGGLLIYSGILLGSIIIRLVSVVVELEYTDKKLYICPFCGEVNERKYKEKPVCIVCSRCSKTFKL